MMKQWLRPVDSYDQVILSGSSSGCIYSKYLLGKTQKDLKQATTRSEEAVSIW